VKIFLLTFPKAAEWYSPLIHKGGGTCQNTTSLCPSHQMSGRSFPQLQPGSPNFHIKGKMEFSLLNSGFHLYHNIWRDWVHLMGSFCVFCNFSHQLSFGGSRGLKSTVLTKTCKGGHLFHQCVIILSLFMSYSSPGIFELSGAGCRDQ
jgi:hypothetical protein